MMFDGSVAENAFEMLLNEHTPDDFLAMGHLHGEFYDYILERIWRFLNENNKN